MKQNLIKAATLFGSLIPATTLMAHSEVSGQGGMLAAVHDLVHVLQAHPLLPIAVTIAIGAIMLYVRNKRRES